MTAQVTYYKLFLIYFGGNWSKYYAGENTSSSIRLGNQLDLFFSETSILYSQLRILILVNWGSVTFSTCFLA